MAEVIISPLLEAIIDKLATNIFTKLELSKDYRREFEKLKNTLPLLQAVIEEAEEKQWEDKKVGLWLKELKDLAYDVDDLLDELTSKALRRKIKAKVRSACIALPSVREFHFMPQKLRNIQKRLDELVAKINGFHFREVNFRERSRTLERRQTGPFVDISEIYGREQDLDAIVGLLVSNDSWNARELCVLPIVGLGGLGKTTLAQLAYNDSRVGSYFDLKLWISLGNGFNSRRIMSEILYFAEGPKIETSQLGVLQSKLCEFLHKKRYLLVLDDLWNEDQDEWEKLRNPLRSGSDGSKVMFTARSRKVASLMSRMPPYFLDALSDEECWSIFMQRAFSDGEEKDYPNLLPMVREIVRKCKGVPLAAKILGGLMRFKRDESEWLHVQETELWHLDESENKILSALRLSYNNLTSNVKRCFVYCAIFPKNFEICREKLVHLWIAEGLVGLGNDIYATRKLEDVGNEYFNELLMISFFQVVRNRDESLETRYQIHGLIHDLAKLIAGREFLTLEDKDELPDALRESTFSAELMDKNLICTRHASIACGPKAPWIPDALFAAKGLRTLRLSLPMVASSKKLGTVFRSFRHLRDLDLNGTSIHKLHRLIDSLVQLRCLDVSNTSLEKLPKTICNLCSLQILNLSGCYNLSKLPTGVTQLVNLRHLMIEGCRRLRHMPPSLRNLLNLQTLSMFIVGCKFENSLFQLVHLELRGKLMIKYLKNVGHVVPDLCLETKQIQSLGLSWGDTDEYKLDSTDGNHEQDIHGCDDEVLLNCLKPNANLQKLYLNGYSGIKFPLWLKGLELLYLRELVITNCSRSQEVPMLGQLPHLEILIMQGFNSVKNIGCEFYSESLDPKFPSLRKLTIKNFSSLETWTRPGSSEAFVCLDNLIIAECPRLKSMPLCSFLKHLELRNCDSMILRSAAQHTSLLTLDLDVFPQMSYLPQGLLQNSNSLRSLTISSCPQLISLPWDLTNLGNLRLLTIRWCGELSSLPNEINNLASLEFLEITECHSLISLPEEGFKGLKFLRSLSIENCHNLISLPKATMHLIALECLTIMYCQSLVDLPDGLEHLSKLRSLNILSCPQLFSLPEGLQHVSSLQNLFLHSCPNLMELPTWLEKLASLRSLTISDCHNLTSLPEGLQHVTGLQHLTVRGCPQLEKRCRNGDGEDWHKISHIQYIHIG